MVFGLDLGKELIEALAGMLPKGIRDALPHLALFLPPIKNEENLMFAFDREGKNRVPADGITLAVKADAMNLDTVKRLVHLTKPDAVVVASGENAITVLWAKPVEVKS